MWNWIAGQYEKNRNSGIGVLKREYIKEYMDIEHILCNCFLCDYSFDVMVTKQIGMFRHSAERCKYCPVIWVSDEDDKEAVRIKCCPCESMGSPYFWVKRAINLEVKSKFAKKIAELPEKSK